MDIAFHPALAASGVAALAATMGLWIAAVRARLADGLKARLEPAAAGVLIATSILHLAPEAFARIGWSAAFAFLAGLAGMRFFDVLSDRLSERMGARPGAAAVAVAAPIAAIIIHSFMDGGAYAVAFAVDHLVGVAAVAGLILHEVGEGAMLFFLFRTAGLRAPLAAPAAFAGAALTTPLGALAALNFAEALTPDALGIAIGVVGGAIFAVGTGRTFADNGASRRAGRWRLIGLAAGAAAALAAAPMHGHSHDELSAVPH